MAETDFADILADESNDVSFDGFDSVDLNDVDLNEINSELDNDDLLEIEIELQREE